MSIKIYGQKYKTASQPTAFGGIVVDLDGYDAS